MKNQQICKSTNHKFADLLICRFVDCLEEAM